MKLCARGRHRAPRDEGNAILETVGLGVVLILPCLYGVLGVFTVQGGVFAATEAARQAGRAFETTTDRGESDARARVAAALAVQDQGFSARDTLELWYVSGPGPGNPSCDGPRLSEPPSVTPGSRQTSHVLVCVRVQVPLPYTDSAALKGLGARIPVTSSYELTADDYRTGG